MKGVLSFFVIIIVIQGSLYAQVNPVEKSLRIYLKKIEKQAILDTLLVCYGNPELIKFRLSKINGTQIIEKNTHENNQVIIKLDLETWKNKKRVILIEQVAKLNNNTNDLEIKTSAVIYINFKVKDEKWKYVSNKINKT